MSQLDRISISHSAAAARADHSAFADVLELTKPRITKMVVVTTGVGFTLAAIGRTWSPVDLVVTALLCFLGTALSASGASALNQWMERDRDGAMPRTANRPLPAGRLSARVGFVVGVVCCVLGVGALAAFVNMAAATVSLATILSYLLCYTTLKPVTPLATLVGAVPGALPPLIGWAAAHQTSDAAWASLLGPGGWSLFFIMFVWQIPHFLAIAWRYRDDYAAGGYRALPAVDPTGEKTAMTALLWAVTLIPVSLAPAHFLPLSPGWFYAAVAVALGVGFALTCVRFAFDRTDRNARIVFFASIIYLPALLGAMVVSAAIVVFTSRG